MKILATLEGRTREEQRAMYDFLDRLPMVTNAHFSRLAGYAFACDFDELEIDGFEIYEGYLVNITKDEFVRNAYIVLCRDVSGGDVAYISATYAEFKRLFADVTDYPTR